MTPLVMQEPPWYFWLVFGLVYGVLFGHFAGLFFRLWQQSKELNRDEERRRWDSLLSGIGARIDAGRSLPLNPSLREAYEQGRWQGMVRSHMHEQTRNLSAVLDRLQQIEDKLKQNGR